jgi:hypothetical protein
MKTLRRSFLLACLSLLIPTRWVARKELLLDYDKQEEISPGQWYHRAVLYLLPEDSSLAGGGDIISQGLPDLAEVDSFQPHFNVKKAWFWPGNEAIEVESYIVDRDRIYDPAHNGIVERYHIRQPLQTVLTRHKKWRIDYVNQMGEVVASRCSHQTYC